MTIIQIDFKYIFTTVYLIVVLNDYILNKCFKQYLVKK